MVFFYLTDRGLVLTHVFVARHLDDVAQGIQERSYFGYQFLNRFLRFIEGGLQVMGHPDQQMHELAKQNVAFSIVYRVLFERCLVLHHFSDFDFLQV